MIKAAKSMALRAPISGRIIPLDRVPDPVFAQRELGEGVAIEPAEGKIYAPVDARITSIAEDLHSYGLTTDSGLEIFIHVGLDMEALKPEDFINYVREGEYVRAGQLIAEVDVRQLRRKGISAITLLLIYNDPNEWKVFSNIGEVMGGMSPALVLKEEPPAAEHQPEEPKNTNTPSFLQKLEFIFQTSNVLF